MNKVSLFCVGALACFGAATSHGQVNTSEGAHVANHGRVNEVNDREKEEEKMIADGVHSGKIGEQQATEFKRRLNQIQADKTSDMMGRHGHLSKESLNELKRQEADLKRDIEAALKKS